MGDRGERVREAAWTEGGGREGGRESRKEGRGSEVG